MTSLVHFPSSALAAELQLTESWLAQSFASLTEALHDADSLEDVRQLLAMSRRCEDLVAAFTTAAGERANALEAQA